MVTNTIMTKKLIVWLGVRKIGKLNMKLRPIKTHLIS